MLGIVVVCMYVCSMYAWDCSSTSLTYIWLRYNFLYVFLSITWNECGKDLRNLISVNGIGFRTIIPEPNQLWPCCLTMMHHIKTLLGITPSTSLTYTWLGYNLYSVIGMYFWTLIPVDLGHDLLSFSHLDFQTQYWMEPARILILGKLMHPINALLRVAQKLYWPVFDLGYDLLSLW